MLRSLAFLSATLAVALVSTDAHADRRVFGWTYPYMTLPSGALELEHYLDAKLDGWDDPSTPEVEESWTEVDWRHQVEFEYGITDRLDFGFYNVFRQKAFGDFGYEGVKLRSRYRFLDEGVLPVDPAIYLEVGYFGNAVKLEEMIILARRVGSLELALNVKAEQEMNLESEEWEYELIPTFGAAWHFTHAVSLGVEYYGKAKFEHGEMEYFASYVGPALSVAGRSFFWTLAAQPRVDSTDEAPQVQVRSLFGVLF